MSGSDGLANTLRAMRQLRTKIDELESAKREPIAIVGIGCRLPGGANSSLALWQLLRDQVDAITPVPKSRWDADAFYDPDPATPGRMPVRHGAFADRVDEFDPYFFGISPREAARMDPQQRLFLEVAWEAMEDAGRTREDLLGSATGVYVGVNSTDYLQLQLADPFAIDSYTTAGGSNCVIPNRLSYLFDLRGPSLAVDTACSSSLVAVHLACQSLRSRESDQAVVGGVNLILSPMTTMAHAKGLPLAPDGRCKTFDESADGYARGEGVAVIVLKRLSDAVASGDRIWAVVRGSAVNQDGLTNGLTAPNGRAQRAVIEAALRNAAVDAADVTLLEAHGTGTSLGDPIEVESLREVYGDRPGARPCALGSVKTNLGHLEAAAGIVGLLKVALSVHFGQIAPNLHLATLNPHIDLDGSRLFIPTATGQWNVEAENRNGAVSAFGAGGTNAHVVLGAAPRQDIAHEPAPGPHLIPISARTPDALAPMAAAYRDFFASTAGQSLSLRDIAHSATRRRTQHEHRMVVVADSHQQAADRLSTWLSTEDGTGVATGRATSSVRPGVVFVCPGQGSQRPGMGRELMRHCGAFRDAVLECDEAMRPWRGGVSVVDQIHSMDADALAGRIDVIQPALFAMSVGLAARWRSVGLEPDVVVGHSMGEVAAAYIAGALTLDDAARIISRRSALLRQISGQGAMLVVALPIDSAAELIAGQGDRVSVAVHNSPTSTVLSGDPETLAALADSLRERNIFCRPVKVDVASHSPQVVGLRDDLLAEFAELTPLAGRTPIRSTVTGELCDGSGFDANYWYRNLREPVLFWDAIRSLAGDGHGVFVELSPHPVLLSAVDQAFEHTGTEGLALPSMRRDEPELLASLESFGKLHTHGLKKLSAPDGQAVSLPSYAWQRERFWFRASGVPVVPQSVSPSGDIATDIATDETACAPTELLSLVEHAAEYDRQDIVFDFIREVVAEILELDPIRVDPHGGFFQMGVDSMLAARIRQRIDLAIGRKLPTPVMFEHPTVHALSVHVTALVSGQGTSQPPRPVERQPVDERPVEELSEEELLAVLADEIRTTTPAKGSLR